VATSGDSYNGWDETKCASYNNSDAVGKSTWPVGSFPSGVSWRGAHDLAGNVYEWCADWSAPYSSTPVTNPLGPASGIGRVLRGGSWDASGGNNARGAFRNIINPESWNLYSGFRCVSLSPGP
jgi:formylglycine-generating enzyme required for sulfatase activity